MKNMTAEKDSKKRNGAGRCAIPLARGAASETARARRGGRS
jgi:hypothetical protein